MGISTSYNPHLVSTPRTECFRGEAKSASARNAKASGCAKACRTTAIWLVQVSAATNCCTYSSFAAREHEEKFAFTRASLLKIHDDLLTVLPPLGQRGKCPAHFGKALGVGAELQCCHTQTQIVHFDIKANWKLLPAKEFKVCAVLPPDSAA